MKVRALVALLGLMAGCGRASEPLECAHPYENRVDSAMWARAFGIKSYRYSQDLESGVATVELVGAGEVMRVWQSYGDALVPDGAMRAELGESSLVTTGRVGPASHEVHAVLAQGDAELEIVARFSHEVCFDTGEAGPDCAGDLVPGGAWVLPSCGLVADNLMIGGVAPVLSELEYRVLGEGEHVDDRGRWQVLRVRGSAGVLPEPEVSNWLTQMGAQWVLESQPQLLAAAFLDRTWWREMDRQVAWCRFDEQGGRVVRELGSKCAGDYCAEDWNQGRGQNTRNHAWGDPHMTSLDGHAFDFQAAGEFVLVRGEGIEIQMRTQPLVTSHPVCSRASVVTGVATKLGEVRLGFYADGSVWVDGERVEPGGAVPVPAGAELTLGAQKSVVVWPDGSELWVESGDAMRLGVGLSSGYQGRVRGVLGDFDGESSNDLVLASGHLPLPTSFADVHGVFADTWRVGAESLFDYGAGEDGSSFVVAGHPAGPLSPEELEEQEVLAARQTCMELGVQVESALRSCIVDVVCGLDPVGVSAAAKAQGVPDSQQPAGWDVVVSGAIEVGQVTARSEDVCGARRSMVLRAESSGALSEDVSVSVSQPGRYGAEDDLVSGTVSAGSMASVWGLRRDAGPADEVLRGTIRFPGRILGVVAEGVQWGDDWFEISTDGRQLRVQFGGEGSDEIRILTEVQ